MEELKKNITDELLLSPDIAVAYMKNCQHAVIAVNENALIILVNHSAELLFGYQKSELIGQAIEILLPDNLKQKHEGHRTGFIDNPRNRPMGISLELKGKKKNGKEITVEINLIPLSTIQGLVTIAEISKR